MSDGEVVDLGFHRRSRDCDEARDCTLWTVLDALRDAMDEIEAMPEDERPTKLVLRAWAEREDEETGNADFYPTVDRFAGVRVTEFIGQMERMKLEYALRFMDK